MNWALKFLPAYVVNLTVLGEPIGATLLGAILPGIRQIPPAITIVGAGIVLIGVLIVARGTVAESAKTGLSPN
jgi:drug/metabolite transporter (DMT)-like permease